MITFLDHTKTIVYSVEAPYNKKVNLVLQFSPKTKRFLSSYYNSRIDLINLQEGLVKYRDIDPSADLKSKTDEELIELIQSGKDKVRIDSNGLDLYEELLDLLNLNEEYEKGLFTDEDVKQIFDCTMSRYGQNVKPENIEKKTQTNQTNQ